MGGRKKYDLNNSRLPDFTGNFRRLVDRYGGVARVSEITGISRPTINFWYNGQRTPDAENLVTLSTTLGISTDWLLGLISQDNSTNDEKLRLISESTGLSNTIIKRIIAMKEKNPRSFALLSEILSTEELDTFLRALEEVQIVGEGIVWDIKKKVATVQSGIKNSFADTLVLKSEGWTDYDSAASYRGEAKIERRNFHGALWAFSDAANTLAKSICNISETEKFVDEQIQVLDEICENLKQKDD